MSVLSRARPVQREMFDASNPLHVESLESYLRTGNWGEVQFWSELPYHDAPSTVLAKFARHTLGVTAETAIEREQRIAKLARPIAPEKPSMSDSNELIALALSSTDPTFGNGRVVANDSVLP